MKPTLRAKEDKSEKIIVRNNSNEERRVQFKD